MIEPHWRRISGIQCQDDGVIAAVWLAHDKDTDTVHCYDAVLFEREVLAVVAEGLAARGRWIPVAWPKEAKEIADKLLERGVKALYEPVESTQPAIEAASLDIWERMRSKRFRVDKRLGSWLEEYRTYYRKDSKVPTDSHPLMAATRVAMMRLSSARRQSVRRSSGRNYPRIAIV